MQTEITVPAPLLDAHGALTHRGWARRLLLDYRRQAVRAPKWRLKEWDYYCVLTETHGLALTVADNGYLGFAAATWFDIAGGRQVTKTVMTPFPMGKIGLPSSSERGDTVFRHPELSISFLREPGRRTLTAESPGFGEGEPLRARLVLEPDETDDSMVIATPFAGAPRAFYYNQKINCQPASGEVAWGDLVHRYGPSSAWAVLDWGRGVWTYDNTWYWASASGTVGGHRLGFNLGCGFGDTTAATENLVFWDGLAHKLDQVSFHIPPDSFLKPWTFTSSDGRLDLSFVPILDRASNTDLLVLRSDQHQVFGRFSGTLILDDRTPVAVDGLLGFAEKVANRW